ncbi:MAG: SufD family Fe-S cluster assembly protein [Actinomycetota bacterium]
MNAKPPGQPAGVDERLVQEISTRRDEPEWITRSRLDAVGLLAELSDPDWWDQPTGFDPANLAVAAEIEARWGTGHPPPEAPAATGSPDAESTGDGSSGAGSTGDGSGGFRNAAVASRFDAARVFAEQQAALARSGVVFCDLGTAVTEHGDLVRPHLGSLVPPDGDRLAAVTAAVWSGGTFLYVPAGRRIDVPLQSFDRIRSASPTRFHRTVIVADEGASVQYIDGCVSPVYTVDPLRSATVEIFVGPSAEVSYTTVQNWSPNVVDVATTAAAVHREGRLVLTAGTIGARRTVRRSEVRLLGDHAAADCRTVSYAGDGQFQDVVTAVSHEASRTGSTLRSRAVADRGGRIHHRDTIGVAGDTGGCTADIDGSALTLDDGADVVVGVAVPEEPSAITATRRTGTAAIDDDLLFDLMSSGVSRPLATALVVDGFIEPIIATLPTEYAVEWSRLIELQLRGAIG